MGNTVTKTILGKSLINKVYKTKVPVELCYYNYCNNYFLSLPNTKLELINPQLGDYSISIPPGLIIVIYDIKIASKRCLSIYAMIYGELYLDSKKTLTDTVKVKNNNYAKYVTVKAKESTNPNFNKLVCIDKEVFNARNQPIQISVYDFFNKTLGKTDVHKPLLHFTDKLENVQ